MNKRKILIMSMVIMLLLTLSTLIAFANPIWATVTVDAGGDVGQHASLAVINGNPAMAYYDTGSDDLLYVRANDLMGAAWGTPITVDAIDDVGQHASLATVNGNPAIAYYDATSGALKYARAVDADGATWGTPQTVFGMGIVGLFADLFVVNGNPAIVFYHVGNGDLGYIRANDANGTTWGTPIPIDTVGFAGFYASAAIVNGNPAVAYYELNSSDLRYVRADDVDGTTWGTFVTVMSSADQVGLHASLEVVNGNPAISFYNFDQGELLYVRATDANGATWPAPTVVDSTGDVGSFTSLAVISGMPAISYRDETNMNLNYVASLDADGTTWDVPEVVDSDTDVGTYSSMTEVLGTPGIGYYDVANMDLKYAYDNPPLLPPSIVVDPASIENKQLTNEMTMHDLDISNVGEDDLNWTIDEAAPFVPAYIEGTHAVSTGLAPVEDAPSRVAGTPLSILLGGTTAYASESVNSYYTIWNTGDPANLPNIAAFAPAGFGGAGIYLNGNSYVLDTANNLYELDGATGTLLNTFASDPPPGAETWAGMAIEPTTGNVYASSTDTGTSSVCLYDVATATASSCDLIAGSAGHIALSFDMAGNAYGYDIVSDQFMTIDPDTGATSNVVALPFDANFGQGMGTDPATGLLIMTAFNNGAFQPEYWSVDVSDPTNPVFNFVGVLGSTDPGGLAQLAWTGTDMSSGGMQACDVLSDIPWASVSPTAGTTISGTTDTAVVTFDSTGLGNGVYTGTLCVSSNDPQQPLIEVPLVMTINVPTDVTMTGLVEGSANQVWLPVLTAFVAFVVLSVVFVVHRTAVRRID